MRKNPERRTAVERIGTAASIVLILSALAALVGCQGFSQSGGGSNQQIGTLVVASPSLSFGDVAPNTSKTQTLTVTNSGNKTVNVGGASFSTKYFGLGAATKLPVSLPAGQSTTLNISFTPDAPKTFTATLSVSSDASNGTQTVALSGAGGSLTLNPTSEAFGSVTVGATKAQTVTITNSDSTSVSISQISVDNTAFSISGVTTPLSVPASQSATFTVNFAPKTSGDASGTITIASDAPNPSLALGVTGTGVTPGALSSNPTSLSFGSVTIGNQSSLSETITNTGASSVTVSQLKITGAGLSVSGIATPLTLTGGQSAKFTVSFVPTTAGAVTGSLTATSTATNSTLTIPISATAVTPGALAANPTSVSFGNVNVGSTTSLSETVTNTGGSSITVSKVAITGAGFSVSNITTPVTISSGKSATFNVSFTPTSAGAVSGNLTVTSTATNPTLTIPVSGTGVSPVGQLAVSPGTLPLGNVTVGSSGTATGTLTASGASVTVTAASTNNGVFTLSGFSLPHTISAGQSANFTITFSPTAA